jgi:hypothetical protein
LASRFCFSLFIVQMIRQIMASDSATDFPGPPKQLISLLFYVVLACAGSGPEWR